MDPSQELPDQSQPSASQVGGPRRGKAAAVYKEAKNFVKELHKDRKSDKFTLKGDALETALDKVGQLSLRQKGTSEGVLISDAIKEIAGINVDQAKKLKAEVSISAEDFLSKLTSKFEKIDDDDDGACGDDGEDDGRDKVRGGRGRNKGKDSYCENEKPPVKLDWVRVALAAGLKRAQVTGFMNGAIESKFSTEKKQAQRKKKAALEVGPIDEVKAAGDESMAATQTDQRVDAMRQLVPEVKTNFWEFVTDPTSFTTTVENIFDFAFVVKTGTAEMIVDQGVPRIRNTPIPLGGSSNEETNVSQQQIVVSFDYDTFQRVCNEYDLQKPGFVRT